MHPSNSMSHDWYQQRQLLEKTELIFKKQQLWLHKREEIEKAISKLDREIEDEFYRYHQRAKFEIDSNTSFQYNLEKNRQLLRQLKKEQIHVDQWLDQIEETTEESIDQQRLALLEEIWKQFPLQREEQEAEWKKWRSLKILRLEMIGIDKILKTLNEYLQIAMQTRKSIKGKGILNYIFGVSPNFMIEKQLIAIRTLITNTLHLMSKFVSIECSEAYKFFLNDLFHWFENLKESCSKSWNFRRLDILFSQTENALKQWMQLLAMHQFQINKEIDDINEKIQGWILFK